MCPDISADATILTQATFTLDPDCMAVSFANIYEWWTRTLEMLEEAGAFSKQPLLYNEIRARTLLETFIPMIAKDAADNRSSLMAFAIELDERHQQIHFLISDDRPNGFEEISQPVLCRINELAERASWDCKFTNRIHPAGNTEPRLTIGFPFNDGFAVHSVSWTYKSSVHSYLRLCGRSEHAKLQTGRNVIEGLSGPTKRFIRDVGRMGYLADPSKEELRRLAERPPVNRSVGVQGIRGGAVEPLLELALTNRNVVCYDLDDVSLAEARLRLEVSLRDELGLPPEHVAEVMGRVAFRIFDLTGMAEGVGREMQRAVDKSHTRDEALKEIENIFQALTTDTWPLPSSPDGRFDFLIVNLVTSVLGITYADVGLKLIDERFGDRGSDDVKPFAALRNLLYWGNRQHFLNVPSWVKPGCPIYWADTVEAFSGMAPPGEREFTTALASSQAFFELFLRDADAEQKLLARPLAGFWWTDITPVPERNQKGRTFYVIAYQLTAPISRDAVLDPQTDGSELRRVPPVLAVEVAGLDDTVEMLREKARWSLDHGVEVVWILVPRARSVIVMTRTQEVEYGPSEVVAEHPALPGLSPRVSDLFRQLER